MNAFILDHAINSRTDLGLRITQPPSTPAAKRVVDSIQVDGREGSLTILRGWEDTVFTMKAALLGTNIPARWRSVLPVILSAKTVYFSTDTAVYYNIKHVDAGPLTQRLSSLYEFPLTFTCAPFRYVRNVAMVTMTTPGSVTNPGSIHALPIIKVYGTGNQTLTVGGKQTLLNILAGNLTLDSGLMECYLGNVAQNNQMQGPFPVFETGATAIAWSSGITKLEIEPRWRFI